jgi:hypothetical protein
MKKSIFLVWIIGILPGTALSQYNESRELTKRFQVLPETRIEITNKYGNLLIHTWDKDSAVFRIEVHVEKKKESRLKKTMEGIDFDFTESAYFLIVRTLVNQSRSLIEKELLKFKESLLHDDGNVEIDYTVWLPETCDLILENKFGNIFMSDFSGSCEINLSNGNLKAHDLLGRTTLILNFADATINQLQDARLETNYSDVEIESSSRLRINSKQSTFELTDASQLEIRSSRDKFRVRKTRLIDAEGNFSSFRIMELVERMNIRSNYGDIDIEKTHPDFNLIYIEAENTDINLCFEAEETFLFELTKTKTETDFCREIEIIEETILDEKTQKTKISGIYGSGQPGSGKLFMNLTAGSMNIFSNR